MPREPLFTSVPHYYGDIARQLMIAGVALMMATAPFYADSLRTQFPFEIAGAIAIVGFAAFTTPFKLSIVLCDAILSGLAVAIFGAWAFFGYDQISGIAFVLRDAIALIFLFAFYFSLKTARAMMLHQVGKPDSTAEFRRMPESAPPVREDYNADEDFDPLAEEKAIGREIDRRNIVGD